MTTSAYGFTVGAKQLEVAAMSRLALTLISLGVTVSSFALGMLAEHTLRSFRTMLHHGR